MKALVFGATGMVGQAVLRECLVDPAVERVVAVGRRPTGRQHPRLRDVTVPDLADLSPVEAELAGFDACFFCVGVSSAGMSEDDYARVTVTLAVRVAETLLRLNPAMTFVFVSGTGADSSERGRVMWARVKGRAENALLAMPFRAVYVIRPAVIIPQHGITSSTRAYRVLYAALRPLLPVIRALAPSHVTTTEQLGRAMIKVARDGWPTRVLESRDIVRV